MQKVLEAHRRDDFRQHDAGERIARAIARAWGMSATAARNFVDSAFKRS